MKRRTRWIIAVAVTVALLLTLLHGCQAGVTPVNVPGSTEAPVTERTADTTGAPEESKAAPETTEAAATELPEISTESTQNTESIQDTEASTEALVETEPETETPTEPTPTEPKPTEPKPTEPKPTEPKPTNPPHSHSWSAWTQTTAPTCSAAGEETRRCSCGAKESRSVAATGNHSWSETAPTCTATGVKTCKTCGKTESTAALGHDWVHHDEEGWWQGELTCYCGAKFYDTYGAPGSCYEAWKSHFFSYIDDEEELDNHGGYQDWSNWIVIKAAYDVCSRCGATNP